MKNCSNILRITVSLIVSVTTLSMAQPTRDSIYYYNDASYVIDYSKQFGVATPDQGLLIAETVSSYNPGGLLYSQMQLRKLWGSSQTSFYFSNPSPLPYPDYWQKDYTTCLEADGSGNYYAGGKYYFDETYRHDAVLIKYNSSLTEVWRSYLYSSPASSEPDDYTVATHVNGTKIYWLGYLGATGYFLSCYTDAGNMVFYVNISSYVPKQVRATPTGDIYILGSSTSATNGSQVVLQKLNSSGTQVWKKTYNALAGLNADIPGEMEVNSSGDIYFSCSSVRVAGSASDGMFVKYNSSGTRVWAKYMNGTANSADGAGAFCFDNSGNIVVMYSLQNSNLGIVNNDVCLRKYNAAGTTLATRYYKGSANQDDYGLKVYYAPNGRFYLTAYTQVTSTKVKSVLAQYDDNLILEYTDVILHSFSPSLFPVPDVLGIYGTTSVLDPDGLHIYWMGIKVKYLYSNGLDNIESPFIVKYSLPAVPRLASSNSDDIAVNIFPNPASDEVVIQSEMEGMMLEVYDVQGKKVADYSMNDANQWNIDLRMWRTGEYIVKLFNREGVIRTGKFLKQ